MYLYVCLVMGNIVPVCIERQRSCGATDKKKEPIAVHFDLKDRYVKKRRKKRKKKKRKI